MYGDSAVSLIHPVILIYLKINPHPLPGKKILQM